MAEDVSRYLEHLPAVFREDPFLGRFLLAFERILSGLPKADSPNLPWAAPGLEQLLDGIQNFFDPDQAPPDFLPWLAGWVATSLREDWDTVTRRRFISNIVPQYRRRGTLRALRTLLQLYLNPDADQALEGAQEVEILEAPKSTDPDQTAFPPRYFQVRFTVAERDGAQLGRKAAIATAIIDREKPAHTFYGLRIRYPSLQIVVPPTLDADGKWRGVFVGVNTVLGGDAFKQT